MYEQGNVFSENTYVGGWNFTLWTPATWSPHRSGRPHRMAKTPEAASQIKEET